MKRILAILICVSFLLTGCFGGNSAPSAQSGLSGLLDTIRGDSIRQEGPQQTVPGTPEHIGQWSDPLEGVPEPTYYTVDEEVAWAMSLIGMEMIPPEDELDGVEPVIPMDGLWNTERTGEYDGTLTAENLQDLFALYARDADLTVLPPVMEPVAEPLGGYAEENAEPQINFLDYYNEQSVLVSRFENFVEKNLDAYNETVDYTEAVYLYLMAFFSMELAMGASFTEDMDWAQLQRGMAMAFEMFGGTDVVILRNEAHSYTVTYRDSDGAQITDHFRADTQRGIEMLSYTDGELTDFFQYMVLGEDTYAWQSGRARLVMTCRDKTVYSCWYSSLPEESQRYTEEDSIFAMERVPDRDWVLERGDFYTEIRFDGTTLTVDTESSWFGSEGYAEMTVNVT